MTPGVWLRHSGQAHSETSRGRSGERGERSRDERMDEGVAGDGSGVPWVMDGWMDARTGRLMDSQASLAPIASR